MNYLSKVQLKTPKVPRTLAKELYVEEAIEILKSAAYLFFRTVAIEELEKRLDDENKK